MKPCMALPYERIICDSRSEENIGTLPDSSSRMICSRIWRVRSSPLLASTTWNPSCFSTICLTSASVM